MVMIDTNANEPTKRTVNDFSVLKKNVSGDREVCSYLLFFFVKIKKE